METSTETDLRKRIAELVATIESQLIELQRRADHAIDARAQVSTLESERDALATRVATLEANAELPLHAPQKTNGAKYVVAHMSRIFETTDEAINYADKYNDFLDELVILSGHIAGRIDYKPVFIPNEEA